MEVGHRSDVGKVRRRNEDGWLIRDVGGGLLAAVADGMGGHPAGDVASAIAIATLDNQLTTRLAAPGGAAGAVVDALVDALVLADADVIDAAAARPDRYRMGTTAVLAFAVPGELAVAHVGDSRAYLVRGGAALPLTRDHGERGFLTQAIGLGDVRPDVAVVDVVAGDRLVMCSDGLSGMVDDATIGSVAASAADVQTAADDLVDAALAAGGYDNVTVVVLGDLGASR